MRFSANVSGVGNSEGGDGAVLGSAESERVLTGGTGFKRAVLVGHDAEPMESSRVATLRTATGAVTRAMAEGGVDRDLGRAAGALRLGASVEAVGAARLCVVGVEDTCASQ